MKLRLPKFKPASLAFAGLLIGGVAVAAVITRAPHSTLTLARVAVSPSPHSSATPAFTPATTTPAPSNQPAVEGVSTQAAPASRTQTTPAALPAPKPSPISGPTVSLSVTTPAGTSTWRVNLAPGADACAILEEARLEGKISALDIDYSTVKSSLHSAYVRQINSYANGWTFKVNGVSPEGCSLSHPSANDQITWRYQ